MEMRKSRACLQFLVFSALLESSNFRIMSMNLSSKRSFQSNEDCYFYYNSFCKKGENCPFRHCAAALGTNTTCSKWLQGRCMTENCKFRHMEIMKRKSTTPCLYEDRPSGCLNPHCFYFHRKPRMNSYFKINNSSSLASVEKFYPVSDVVEPTSTSFDDEDKENLSEEKRLELKKLQKVFKDSVRFYEPFYDSPIVNPAMKNVEFNRVKGNCDNLCVQAMVLVISCLRRGIHLFSSATCKATLAL